MISIVGLGFTFPASKKISINYNYNFAGPEVYTMSKINNLKICQMRIRHYERVSGVLF